MYESLNFALGLGFLLGLKHATEADHVVAVTTIVSEQRSIWPSSMIGVLWGAGHTAALLLAGILVILMQLTIPERVAILLELTVALVIIFLGGRILYLVLLKQRQVHIHVHKHGKSVHAHLHFHDAREAHAPGDERYLADERHHASVAIGWRPFLVGALHGLAGSAALTLLILTEVLQGGSGSLGLVYLLVFGMGSLGGMLLMSAFISLPFAVAANLHSGVLIPVRLLAGIGGVAFGIYYGLETVSRL